MSHGDLTCSHCGRTGHLAQEADLSRYEVFCTDISKWCIARESMPSVSIPVADGFFFEDGWRN